MTLIDAYGTLSHYREHLLPIWRELERYGAAGQFFSPRAEPGFVEIMAHHQTADTPVLVASFTDAQKWQDRPVIYVEHGAGQAYEGVDIGSYSGGTGLDNVVLFLSPSQRVADRWLVRYPFTPAVAVGCPKLDRFHLNGPRSWTLNHPTVAIAFHWDLGLIPETRWALPHYKDRFVELRDFVASFGGRLVGHGHPRFARALHDFYDPAGIPWVDADTLFDQADILLVDNSSIGYEFASLGKPTIWMDAPFYRRDVHHGLRFWDAIPGPHVADMDELLAVLDDLIVFEESEAVATERERVVAEVYTATDGHAAERAAAAILGML